jgi:hypothetical protein
VVGAAVYGHRWPCRHIVGGVITYYTTRSAHTREEEAERQRQRAKQITDIAIRFIQAVSKQSVNSMNIKRTVAEYQSLIEKALEGGNPAEALAHLNTPQALDPEKLKDLNDLLKDAGSQLKAASDLLEGVGAAEPTLSELNMLLAEMRLVLPNEIIHIAELVSAVSFVAQVSSALPFGISLAIGGAAVGALNVFVNAVRQEVGLSYYIPKNVKLGDIPKVLQELSDKQTNAART